MTKLDQLIAEAVGYVLRDTSPFGELPDGLTLNFFTGIILAVPAGAGTFRLVIRDPRKYRGQFGGDT